MENLKIIELRSENVKRIKAVQITPEGNTVLITGANGAGKSSVIDSILYACDGRSLPAMPIRDDEEEAEINLDLGELKIQRTFKKGGKKTLKVFSKDGAMFSSPQDILNKLVGELSFDPMKFLTVVEKEQRQILLDICGISVESLDEKRLKKYTERADINRRVKELEGKLKGRVVSDLPTEEKSAKELTGFILEENQKITDKVNLGREVSQLEGSVETHIKTIEELEGRLVLEKNRLQSFYDEIKSVEKKKDAIKTVNVDVLNIELSAIEETNAAIRANNEALGWHADLDVENANKLAKETELQAIDKEKEELVASAKMPIEGLSFSEDSVIFEGIPLKQVNSADQFKVCLAISMALNPKLKVILFKNGSLLDKKSLKYVSDLADKHDYQVWIEKVDESGEVGIVIEDGQVKK